MSMSVLKKSDLVKMSDGSYIDGYVLLKSYTKQPTKNGGFYITGGLEAVGAMQFKVWGNADCFKELDSYDYSDTICFISGKINVYGGVVGLVLETCKAIEESEDLSKADFFEAKYDAEAYWKTLVGTVKKHVSEEAFRVFELLFTDEIREKFITEFAAVSHHDNCRAGLLAHTAKVVKLCTVIRVYDSIMSRVGSDLLFVGAAVHDLGKILEYDNGSMSKLGRKLSHNTIGISMLEAKKSEIVALKGEEFFYMLESIVSQHHGEYGEEPRTVAAYVIHLIDCLDSNLTSLNQQLEGIERDSQIGYGGMKLS